MNPLFESVMGMDSSPIYGMFPVGERKAGVILHAKDDNLAIFEDVEKALDRFPNCTLVAFETGGQGGNLSVYSFFPGWRRLAEKCDTGTKY